LHGILALPVMVVVFPPYNSRAPAIFQSADLAKLTRLDLHLCDTSFPNIGLVLSHPNMILKPVELGVPSCATSNQLYYVEALGATKHVTGDAPHRI
jgi:hypothetical protein